MKKMMMAAVAVIFTAGIVTAQDSQTKKADAVKRSETPASAVKSADANVAPAACDKKNCIMKMNGKMVQMTDGKEMPVTADVKLKNGLVVSAEGIYVDKDGKKVVMKDGDCIDMNGKTCVMKADDHHDHNHNH